MKASDRGRNVKSKEFLVVLMNFVLVCLIQPNETFLFITFSLSLSIVYNAEVVDRVCKSGACVGSCIVGEGGKGK